MRALIQRVLSASVRVDDSVIGEIGSGLLVLLGVAETDTEDDLQRLARKTLDLRIFDDESGKMNRSLADVGGELLVVSQFTLLADCRKGRRPSYLAAARPDKGERFYEQFVEEIRRAGVPTATGRFGASMQVALVNDGPVTIWLDSETL